MKETLDTERKLMKDSLDTERRSMEEILDAQRRSAEVQLQQASMIEKGTLKESLQEIETWKQKYDEDMKMITLKKNKKEQLLKTNARLTVSFCPSN